VLTVDTSLTAAKSRLCTTLLKLFQNIFQRDLPLWPTLRTIILVSVYPDQPQAQHDLEYLQSALRNCCSICKFAKL
jgi:hypothetical protein